MACFLVPAAEAVAVTVALGVIKAKQKKAAKLESNRSAVPENTDKNEKHPFVKKLKWLAGLLWGGAFLLAFEHVWHGEVVPWFPFLTAAAEPDSAVEMLTEMGTVGVTMALIVTAAWLAMVLVTGFMEKKARADAAKAGAQEV